MIHGSTNIKFTFESP